MKVNENKQKKKIYQAESKKTKIKKSYITNKVYREPIQTFCR